MSSLAENPAFDRFLFRGAGDAATIDLGSVRIERRSLGSVELPDGHIYVCDPVRPQQRLPLALQLKPGEYQAVLFVAVRAGSTAPGPLSECNAAAALVIGDASPSTWEVVGRQDGGQSSAYEVDSGIGCFLGSGAAAHVFSESGAGSALLPALRDEPGAIVDLGDGARVFAFKSGIEDRVCDTWLARDDRGQVTMVLTDLGILESARQVQRSYSSRPVRIVRPWWHFWR